MTTIATILIVTNTITLFFCLSLSYRRSYLRQKCLNRMSKEEVEVMNKTDLDFWSFIK
jgi:hypothetical protein